MRCNQTQPPRKPEALSDDELIDAKSFALNGEPKISRVVTSWRAGFGKSLTFGARPGSIPAMAWRRAFKGSSRRTDQPVRKSSLKSRSGRSFADGISHPTHRR